MSTDTKPIGAGVALNFYLGQRVRLIAQHARGFVGRITSLEIGRHDSPCAVSATVVLEKPIISKALEIDGQKFPETEIWTQFVPLTDLEPYSEADEVVEVLRRLANGISRCTFSRPQTVEGLAEAHALLAKYPAVHS